MQMFDCSNDETISIQANSVDIAKYLQNHGIPDQVVDIFTKNTIDGLSLCLLTEKDLQEMNISQIGIRKRILFLCSLWRHQVEKQRYGGYALPRIFSQNSLVDFLSFNDNRLSSELQPCRSSANHNNNNNNTDCAVESSLLNDSEYGIDEDNSNSWKLLISFLYFIFSTCVTAFVIVLAHERLPVTSKYPPLPDLFLDNLPHIGWGFIAAELVGIVLFVIWSTILILHKYRWILIRRFFVLMGTIFLLRSVTMIITSLSVPGSHLTDQCSPYIVKNYTQRFKRVLEIWKGLGLYITGIQTCGDYLFSGHTTCLTLLNFFITEYTPRKFHLLHTFSWVLNLFGVFFILACHEHYSIDVFIAIYLSSRLFLYYHCLANSNILHQPGNERTKIWFPLFSFFENNVTTVVPNVYEIPFRNNNNYFSKCNHSNTTNSIHTTTNNNNINHMSTDSSVNIDNYNNFNRKQIMNDSRKSNHTLLRNHHSEYPLHNHISQTSVNAYTSKYDDSLNKKDY
uniref:SAM domain-containing protein n=1 Tax=Trichobilharzia regenti TaxID=157069 RepID=A0AA85JS35_TRIRE|nr:unnamed protein product [Trichobilharzia regenti]